MNIQPYKWHDGGFEITRSICWSPPGCHGGCGIQLYVKDGKLRKVAGDTSSFFNSGQICIRGKALPDYLYHPDRLIHPLIRLGKRGSNKWGRISYKEAIDLISDRFLKIKKEYGAESVIFCKGTARDIGGYLPRLCYGFGSPNYFGLGPGNGNACFRPRVAVSTAVLGGMPVPDLGQFKHNEPISEINDRCIVIWGANPTASNPDGFHSSWLLKALSGGAKLIVVDPRKTELAEKADIWLKIHPGSDGALALAMAKIIFENNWGDHNFCEKWVIGLDDLRKRCEEFNLDEFMTVAGPDKKDIYEAARLIASSQASSLIWGVGVDMNAGCIGSIHGILALFIITGKVEKPDCLVLSTDPSGILRRGDKLTDFPHISEEPIGWKEYPLMQVGNPYAQPDILLKQLKTGNPYPIKGAWLQGTAVLPSSFAQPLIVKELFRTIEFIVMVDIFMNPGAVELADIILPAAMFPERDGLYVHYSQVGAINKAVEPPGECRSDMQIILDVGKNIAPEYFHWDNTVAWYDFRLKPAGISFNELRDKGPIQTSIDYYRHELGVLRDDKNPGFNTPSGKIELKSSILAECNLNPLPYYEDELSDYRQKYNQSEYPFILTSGVRRKEYFCSEGRMIDKLREKYPHPLVTIHTEDAEENAIQTGDLVEISSPFGKCRMSAKVEEQFSRGTIHCDYGWWYPERGENTDDMYGLGDCNVNNLFPLDAQGKSGFGYPFRLFICNIKKLQRYA